MGYRHICIQCIMNSTIFYPTVYSGRAARYEDLCKPNQVRNVHLQQEYAFPHLHSNASLNMFIPRLQLPPSFERLPRSIFSGLRNSRKYSRLSPQFVRPFLVFLVLESFPTNQRFPNSFALDNYEYCNTDKERGDGHGDTPV